MAGPCDPIMKNIADLENERRELQEELKRASTPDKPFLASQIKKLTNRIKTEKQALKQCLEDHPLHQGPLK
jgi:hypothetical protein